VLARAQELHDLLVRLADGTHVNPKNAVGQPQAFLPGAVETDFPTVKASVCSTDGAREFLESLGLREPDPVDDVVVNVLPKYHADQVSVGDDEYAADIRRILAAFQTDSTSQRDKLTEALEKTHFVKAVDGGDGAKVMAEPGAVYLATERLKELFEGVGGALLVDNSYECLRGQEARQLLEACGVSRYLRPISVRPDFLRRLALPHSAKHWSLIPARRDCGRSSSRSGPRWSSMLGTWSSRWRRWPFRVGCSERSWNGFGG
jgi:hypothetical protein